jgi:hypothetical protein
VTAAIGIGEQKHGQHVLAPEGPSEYIEASPPCDLVAGRRVAVAKQNHTDLAAHLPEGRDHIAPTVRVVIDIEHDGHWGVPNHLADLRPSPIDDHPPRAVKNRLQTVPVVCIPVCQNDSKF